MPGNQVAQQRLYLTADKDRLVRQDDPAAAFLYCTPGDEIPESAAERFGLVDGRLKAKRSEGDLAPRPVKVTVARTAKPKAAKAAPAIKEKPAPENKEAKPDENKSGEGQGGGNGGGAS